MKTTTLAFILLLAVALTGCGTSMYIASDYDDSIDFASYRSFDWRTPPSGINDPLADHPTVALRIKRAIEDDLEAKGYRKVDEAPDFYVVYHAAVEQRITRVHIDRWGYRYPRFRGPRMMPGSVFLDTYEVGTLLIDVVDAETDELVWQGTATDVVRADAQRAREQLDEAVQKILAEFPPPSEDVAAGRS